MNKWLEEYDEECILISIKNHNWLQKYYSTNLFYCNKRILDVDSFKTSYSYLVSWVLFVQFGKFKSLNTS